MKTISLHGFPASRVSIRNQARPSIVKRILEKSRDFAHAMKNQSVSFTAIGLAEGGDVEGASQLIEQSTRR
jgi:hypothetical protein